MLGLQILLLQQLADFGSHFPSFEVGAVVVVFDAELVFVRLAFPQACRRRLLLDAGRNAEHGRQLADLMLVQRAERRDVDRSVAPLGIEAGNSFGSMVRADDEQVQLSRQRVLGHHARARLDVAFDAAVHVTGHADGFEPVLHFKRNLVDSFLDVGLHAVSELEGIRDLVAVRNVDLLAVRLEHAESDVLPAGFLRQLVGRSFAQSRCDSAVDAAADGDEQSRSARFFHVILQEIHPAADFLFRIDAWLDAQLGNDFLLKTHGNSSWLKGNGLAAETVERAGEIRRNFSGGAVLDLMPFDEMHKLAILEQGDGRGRRRVRREVFASLGCRFLVLPGENRVQVIRRDVMVQRVGNARTALSGCAAADGVDDDKRSALGIRKLLLHFLGRAQLLDSQTGQLVAHRLNHIEHVSFKRH
ncbi:hypothetical protein BN871_EP_00090 [Paenibacillus sp. P22]|nr:hypothetical protein BN871_EP_00090 [Paenibacillus sp. P22]